MLNDGSSSFTIHTVAEVSPDEFASSLDYEEAIQFITDVDYKYEDVQFSLYLAQSLVETWDAEDFKDQELELTQIIDKLQELRGW